MHCVYRSNVNASTSGLPSHTKKRNVEPCSYLQNVKKYHLKRRKKKKKKKKKEQLPAGALEELATNPFISTGIV